MLDLKNFDNFFEGVDLDGNIDKSFDNADLADALSMSDGPIKIGDYVVPFNKEGAADGSLVYLNSKRYFKVVNTTKTEIDIGYDFTFKAKRFKKVELSGNIDIGDVVVVVDDSRKKLPIDVYEYLTSRPYFEVISSKKIKVDRLLLDIGYRDDNNVLYWFSYNRFLASKPMTEILFKQFEDEKKYVEENKNKIWIDPEKLVVAKIDKLEKNSVDFDVVDVGGKKNVSMAYKRFVEYFYVLGKEHLDFVYNKIKYLDNKKKSDIQALIARYEKPYSHYDGIIKLIKKYAE